jgi:hypothetical protein
MNQSKLKVCEYFDNLVNRLDLAVEGAITDNYHDTNLEDELNKQRDVFIKEIRYVETYNLRALSDMDIKPGEVLSDEELFPKFCFFIELAKRDEK